MNNGINILNNLFELKYMPVKAISEINPLILLCKSRVWMLICIACSTVSLSFVCVLPNSIALLLGLCEPLINRGKRAEYQMLSKEKNHEFAYFLKISGEINPCGTLQDHAIP